MNAGRGGSISGRRATAAIVCTDGTLLCHQPYGEPRLLVCDVDPSEATCLLARRYRGEGLD